MATIDYKEKYEQALERARQFSEKPYLEDSAGIVGYIFPELAESDDERIRKALINGFKDYKGWDEEWFDGITVREAIAWLEKQGEKKPVPDWMPKFLDELRSKKNYFDWDEHRNFEGRILAIIEWMNPNYFNEKDGNQKADELPKGEDYGIDGLYAAIDILKNTLGKVDGYQTDDGILEHKCAISAVKSLYEQKPAKWSEEDITQLHFIKSNLEYLRDNCKDYKDDDDQAYLNNQIDWLKSIKDRVLPQQKQEWSGGDEAHLHSLITHLEQWIESNPDTTGADIQGENVAWLKSLRPQSQWKPSDTQMAAIACAVRNMKESACYNSELVSLFDDLKKLKE